MPISLCTQAEGSLLLAPAGKGQGNGQPGGQAAAALHHVHSQSTSPTCSTFHTGAGRSAASCAMHLSLAELHASCHTNLASWKAAHLYATSRKGRPEGEAGPALRFALSALLLSCEGVGGCSIPVLPAPVSCAAAPHPTRGGVKSWGVCPPRHEALPCTALVISLHGEAVLHRASLPRRASPL